LLSWKADLWRSPSTFFPTSTPFDRYAWADEPRNCAVCVVTGFDEDACIAGAEELGKLFWDAHEDFQFVAPTGSYRECLDAAVKSNNADRPFFISDSGDNPTAGGDYPALTRLLLVVDDD